jgi:hypothetical protein
MMNLEASSQTADVITFISPKKFMNGLAMKMASSPEKAPADIM